MGRFKDLTGQKFGKLTAKKYLGGSRWECECECGSITRTPRSYDLLRGFSTSCGCYTVERTRSVSTTHGMTGTRTYRAWSNMIQRCTNPKNGSYPDYGGRGITVCERWMVFENFLADMGPCDDNLTIERLDNSKGYEPGNCTWIPKAQQSANRRNIVRVCGLTTPELSALLGLKPDAIYMRIHRDKPKFTQQVKELLHGRK